MLLVLVVDSDTEDDDTTIGNCCNAPCPLHEGNAVIPDGCPPVVGGTGDDDDATMLPVDYSLYVILGLLPLQVQTPLVLLLFLVVL